MFKLKKKLKIYMRVMEYYSRLLNKFNNEIEYLELLGSTIIVCYCISFNNFLIFKIDYNIYYYIF